MITDIGQDLDKATTLLASGEIVAVPTETVYGLAANALDEQAVLKIFKAKERPFFDPLIVHFADLSDVEKYISQFSPTMQNLAEAFWPGPLTLLLPRNNKIPDLVTSGLSNVGCRVPSHPLFRELLKNINFPVAAPSANPFGYVSPTTANHVYDQLKGKVPYILEGGSSAIGIESTIVSEENGKCIIHRLGGLTVEAIRKVAGKVILNINTSSDPSAPGMLKNHYATRKKLFLVSSDDELKMFDDDDTILICIQKPGVWQGIYIELSNSGDMNEAARNLFKSMRDADKSDADRIVALKADESGLGRAINDRLLRASYQF